MENLFSSVFDANASLTIDIYDFMICMIVAILLGLFMAKMYEFKTSCTKGFICTLAALPLAVTMVIMMVNGNIGTGVAVAGAFSLIRFRSVPGSAKEIAAIFIAMCTGLTIGMGYIAFAILFTIIASLFSHVLNFSKLGESNSNNLSLHITIPENLNYTDVFDDIFKKYTSSCNLVSSRTTNLGSLFKLSYAVELKKNIETKDFIDELRIRNGNLEIMLTKQEIFSNTL